MKTRAYAAVPLALLLFAAHAVGASVTVSITPRPSLEKLLESLRPQGLRGDIVPPANNMLLPLVGSPSGRGIVPPAKNILLPLVGTAAADIVAPAANAPLPLVGGAAGRMALPRQRKPFIGPWHASSIGAVRPLEGLVDQALAYIPNRAVVESAKSSGAAGSQSQTPEAQSAGTSGASSGAAAPSRLTPTQRQALKRVTALFIATLILLVLMVAGLIVLTLTLRRRVHALEKEEARAATELEDLWWRTSGSKPPGAKKK